MSKVAILAKLSARPDRRDDLVAVLTEFARASRREPGTEVFELHAGDERDVVWTYEVFTDDAAFIAHRDGDVTKAVVSKLSDLLAGAPEITRGTPLTL